MLHDASPESQGIPSAQIAAYLEMLDKHHLAMHDVLISRGDKILLEAYYAPFRPGEAHRLYSVTKSFVALAVGFALEDGLLSLDDPMSKYFGRELEGQPDHHLSGQTVRHMMMMSTAKPGENWFAARTSDRVRLYFQNKRPETREPGKAFEYDSSGTFVIGALVERLTGKKLLDYLREKLFDRIGVSTRVRALSCPGGHTWSDSAFLMPPDDLWRVARFVLNGGRWDGKQLLSPEYIREATSKLISTGDGYGIERQGYGFYIWKAYGEGFFFNGMGCQLALCVPEKDLILICNADNQGNEAAKDIILDGFYQMIVAHAGDPLPEDPPAAQALSRITGDLKLFSAYGSPCQPMAEKINGAVYGLGPNPMGISRLSLAFSGSEGVLTYTNAQGEKRLPFGLCGNRFCDFPQRGYADQVGSVPGGRLYRCAASAAWKDTRTLWLKVQVIDDYLGNMDALFTFSEDGRELSLTMRKTAEDFLDEYEGDAAGRRQ